jgi:predicted nucleic acid-binding protein
MARDPRETRIVNQALMSNGLGKLDDPGLVRQLGFLVAKVVNEHEDFRVLINRCDPEKRPEMYEALKPYIRFALRPLDWYIARSMEKAEVAQLPTLDDAGNLREFNVQDVRGAAIEPLAPATDLQTAQRVMDEALARQALVLLCTSCTKEQTFHGLRREDAVRLARAAGWELVHDVTRNEAHEVCGECIKKYFPPRLIHAS